MKIYRLVACKEGDRNTRVVFMSSEFGCLDYWSMPMCTLRDICSSIHNTHYRKISHLKQQDDWYENL